MDASTGQYRGSLTAPRQPGATATQLVQEFPALAAAAGGIPVVAAQSVAAAKSGETEYTTGKSSAENFIFKPPVKT